MSSQANPFAVRMILLRVTWMDRYQGITGGDTTSRGGAFVAEHGFGHEIFNFQAFGDRVYGYVQPPPRGDRWEEARINLARLGAGADQDYVADVLAVWVATAPSGGAFVIGWYRNAIVYRNWQAPPKGSRRQHAGADCGYFISAKAEDATLLGPDERIFPIPQKGKGEFGQSQIWYADDPERHRHFRQELLRYIETKRLSKPRPASRAGAPRQPDPLLRQRIEQTAIGVTAKHFRDMGYEIDSVERDNVGWDLEATLGKRRLKLEVKGLSGSHIVVDLTPGEYAAMREYRDSYRVCVVVNALNEPKLVVFAFSPDSNRWESLDGLRLEIQEIVAARCSEDE